MDLVEYIGLFWSFFVVVYAIICILEGSQAQVFDIYLIFPRLNLIWLMNSYFLTLDAALFTGSSFLEILTGNLKNIYMKIV